MQTDVKAVHTEVTATLYTGRTRVKGYHCISGGTAGDVIYRDGGASGVGSSVGSNVTVGAGAGVSVSVGVGSGTGVSRGTDVSDGTGVSDGTTGGSVKDDGVGAGGTSIGTPPLTSKAASTGTTG